MDNFDEDDQQLDSLRINSWEDDTLDQYVNDLDKNVNENIQYEKDQCSQKLFQAFQTSACAVAQMFKERAQAQAWNSFQEAAGSITVLYKDSLDSCKINFDMGVNVGQQRKVKELINWLRKKKRRHLRKDELISFLIGKPAPSTRSSLFNRSNSMMLRHHQLSRCNQNDVNSCVQSATHSDLATFREALIMHSRTHAPQTTTTPQNTTSSYNNNNFATTSSSATIISSNLFSQAPPPPQQQQPLFSNNIFSTPIASQQQQQQHHHHHHHTSNHQNCDDLDCFFCEQVATHIEHKRSANSTDLDSPTRKRGRFY